MSLSMCCAQLAYQRGTVYWPAQDASVLHPASQHLSAARFQAPTRCGSTASDFLPDRLPLKSVTEGMLDQLSVYTRQSQGPAGVSSICIFMCILNGLLHGLHSATSCIDLPVWLNASAD